MSMVSDVCAVSMVGCDVHPVSMVGCDVYAVSIVYVTIYYPMSGFHHSATFLRDSIV